MLVPGTIGGADGISVAANAFRHPALGHLSERPASMRSYWCTWQQWGQAVQNVSAAAEAPPVAEGAEGVPVEVLPERWA
jgi:hypothetical protein